MKLLDFLCVVCDTTFEDLVRDDERPNCPVCGEGPVTRLFSGTHTCHVIIPTSLHSKKRKAGYVHSHGDRPKTPGKIQVGYTGK